MRRKPAEISQIEKYQTAVHTFQSKYNCLPGDYAAGANFGFPVRGALAGEGDGNGMIEGIDPNNNTVDGYQFGYGEARTFWVDLSQSKLIAENLNSANPETATNSLAPAALFPPGKVANTYVNVHSVNGINYFTLANTASAFYDYGGIMVSQASNIDQKIDDGLPQSGRVQANFANAYFGDGVWWACGGVNGTAICSYIGGAPFTTATASSPDTCFDNGNSNGAAQHYSMEVSNGNGLNCTLTFQFQ